MGKKPRSLELLVLFASRQKNKHNHITQHYPIPFIIPTSKSRLFPPRSKKERGRGRGSSQHPLKPQNPFRGGSGVLFSCAGVKIRPPPKPALTPPKTTQTSPKTVLTPPKFALTSPKIVLTFSQASHTSPRPVLTSPKFALTPPKVVHTVPKPTRTSPKTVLTPPKLNHNKKQSGLL